MASARHSTVTATRSTFVVRLMCFDKWLPNFSCELFQNLRRTSSWLNDNISALGFGYQASLVNASPLKIYIHKVDFHCPSDEIHWGSACMGSDDLRGSEPTKLPQKSAIIRVMYRSRVISTPQSDTQAPRCLRLWVLPILPLSWIHPPTVPPLSAWTECALTCRTDHFYTV